MPAVPKVCSSDLLGIIDISRSLQSIHRCPEIDTPVPVGPDEAQFIHIGRKVGEVHPGNDIDLVVVIVEYVRLSNAPSAVTQNVADWLALVPLRHCWQGVPSTPSAIPTQVV